jgi:ADP-ribosylglycohydrolase
MFGGQRTLSEHPRFMTVVPDLARARLSLEGLSLGDSFGELFFSRLSDTTSFADLPEGPWRWTDDTHMALSIVEVLEKFGAIDQDALAQAFARRFAAEPYRGYARGAMALLRQIRYGVDWRTAAPALFKGGSYGYRPSRRSAAGSH